MFEYPADPFSWGVAVLFSLILDIDMPTSRIGRPQAFCARLYPISNLGYAVGCTSCCGTSI